MKTDVGTEEQIITGDIQLKVKTVDTEKSDIQDDLADALRWSEELNKSITNLSADAIISISNMGIIQSWNGAAETIFGYDAAEMINKELSEIIPDRYKADHRNAMNRLNNNGKEKLAGQTIELTALRKDGTEIPVELSISSWIVNNKKYYTGIIHDISKRKQTEEILNENEDKYRNLIETASEGFWLVDPERKTIDVNQSLCNMLGYSRNEILEKTPFDFMDEENHKIFNKQIVNSKSTKHRSYEISLKKKNGDNIPALFNATSIFDINGKLTGAFAFITDFTERKHNEQLQTLLYNISQAVSISDDIPGLIQYIKEQLSVLIDTSNFYVAMYDKKTDTFSLPFHEDQKDEFASIPAGKTLTAYVIKTKKALLATKEVTSKLEESGEIDLVGTASEIWLGVPLFVNGKVSGAFAVQSYDNPDAYDESDMEMLEFVSKQISISIERKRAEQELKIALQKATESDNLKSAFINNISHEIRTPLGAIIGLTDILNDDEISAEEKNEFTEQIKKSGNELLEIVSRIMTVAKLKTGNFQLNKNECYPLQILNNVLNDYKSKDLKGVKENINLIFDTNSKYNPRIFSDETKIFQVVSILIENAIKYSFKGKIQINIGYKPSNNDVLFYVKDKGVGIPRDKIDDIFKLFTQNDNSATREHGGVGISLTLSQLLIEQLGGKIWVESERDKGSCFYFTVPKEVNK